MKNILISGGSRGIGAETVRLLCEQGERVAFTYKNSNESARLLEERTGAFGIFCDMEREADIIAAAKEAKRFFGESGVDVLINNAAISEIKLFTDITLEDWQRMIAVDLTAPYILTRELLPDMIHKKSGRIINISSIWGICGASCEVHYSAAKAGLIGMTKALAKEVGLSGIRVNCVAPGAIETDMLSSFTAEDMEALRDETPLTELAIRQILRKHFSSSQVKKHRLSPVRCLELTAGL